MKALWKVPASVILIAVCAVLLFALFPPCMLLTALWLPLSMGGAISEEVGPPMFWPLNLVSAVFDWWAGL